MRARLSRTFPQKSTLPALFSGQNYFVLAPATWAFLSMAEELSYVLVTPHSIRKSRTGGIISRLISRTSLDLVAARMFTPSQELVEKYAETLVTDPDPRHRELQEQIKRYVLANFPPKENGTKSRVLLLVFKGEDAVAKLRHTVGHIVNERASGETIRDTYGDYVV